MGSIRMVLGRTRHRRLQALAAADSAPHTTLWVTGHRRAREAILRGVPGPAALLPEVRDLPELLTALWARCGDGRALLTPQAARLAARHVLETGATEILGQGGAILAAQLARLDQRLAHHRLPGVGDPRIDSVLAALRRHVAQRGHVRASDAWEHLLRQLQAPGPTLRAWLARPRRVVIDEMLGATPLEVALLLQLARSWSVAGAHVSLTFASGRGRGGAEAGPLLGWDTDTAGQPEIRTFHAAAGLRRAMLELVGTGEASVWVAGVDGALEIEPWTEPSTAERPDLADWLAEGTRVPVRSPADAARVLAHGRIQLIRASDPGEEVQAAAHGVARALARGADPGDCVVAVAGLAGLRPLIEHALADAEVPFEVMGGTSLSWLPVVRAVRTAVGIGVDGPAPGPLCALAERLGMPLNTSPRVLRRQLAQAGLGPDPATWESGLRGWLVRNRAPPAAVEAALADLTGLRDLGARCAVLADPAEPRHWQATLVGLLEALGFPASCGEDAAQLQAWARCVDAIQTLADDLGAVHPGTWPARVIADELDHGLERITVQPFPRQSARVAVLDAADLAGPPPIHAWVLGLSRGAFPRPTHVDFLVPAALRRRLAEDRAAEGRYLLASWLREALEGRPLQHLVLSWPATREGRTAPPSPLLADLLSMPTDAGVAFGDLAVQAPTVPPDAWSSAIGHRRLAADPSWASALPADLVREHQRQADAVHGRQGPLGPRDGLLQVAPSVPEALSVTALEDYLRCPQRYWYDRILGLAPADAWAPELEPRRRGTALHRILERFLTAIGLRSPAAIPRAEHAGLRQRLAQVAATTLDEIEAEGGFDPAFQAYARSRWLAGLTDDAPAGILAAWLHQEITADPPRVPLAVEAAFEGLPVGPVRLRGALDRLDRLTSGALVVTDYKTGAAPARRSIAEGLSLQPYAYAEAVRRDHPEASVVASFQSLARPDALQRSGWVGEAAVLDSVCTPGERRAAVAISVEEQRAVLARAGAQAEGLRLGRFPTTVLEPELARCPTCPHRRICRVDRSRAHDGGVA